MNGASGSHAWPEWREHRAVFESDLTPCATTPASAVAYLFGPVDGRAVLAVRAVGEGMPVRVTLPASFQAGEADNGSHLELVAGRQPTFLPLLK